MDFKDAVAADIENVFFRTDEFAEMAVIDGKPVPLVSDEDALNGKTDEYAKGLSQGDRLIFVKVKDLKRRPNVDEQIEVFGEKWKVQHCVLNVGVYEIRIRRNKGNAR